MLSSFDSLNLFIQSTNICINHHGIEVFILFVVFENLFCSDFIFTSSHDYVIITISNIFSKLLNSSLCYFLIRKLAIIFSYGQIVYLLIISLFLCFAKRKIENYFAL